MLVLYFMFYVFYHGIVVWHHWALLSGALNASDWQIDLLKIIQCQISDWAKVMTWSSFTEDKEDFINNLLHQAAAVN